MVRGPETAAMFALRLSSAKGDATTWSTVETVRRFCARLSME
jgi:hypothetical protein